MATSIQALPCLLFDMTVGNNEDWQDSWPYPDGNGNSIPVAGIVFNFTLKSLATGALLVVASNGPSVGGLPLNGAVASGGATGNVVALNIPRAAMQRLPAATAGYAHETQAVADGITRTVARGTVTILQGQAP